MSKTVAKSAAKTVDVLGDEGRARGVAQMLSAIQEQRWALDLERVANGWGDEMVVGVFGGVEETLAQKHLRLEESEARILVEYQDYLAAVNVILNRKD